MSEADKVAGYQQLVQRSVHRDHWPETSSPAVRVFYVCPSQQRIATLSQHLRGTPAASFYRFALREELTPASALTELIWADAEGKRYSIVRRSA